MLNLRNAVLWLVIAGVAVWLISLKQSPTEQVASSLPNIPENTPDIYIEGLDSSRMNSAGELVLTTQAHSLAVYEQENISLFEQPTVQLYQEQNPRWQITSQSAQLMAEDDIEFLRDVEVIQLNANTPISIFTDYLLVTEQGQRISTDQPVKILKGQQVTNAVGMEVKLDTIEPLINLLSDVSFIYDPA